MVSPPLIAIGLIVLLGAFYPVKTCGGGSSPINTVSASSAAVGAIGAIAGYYLEILKTVFTKVFGKGRITLNEWKSISQDKPITCAKDLNCNVEKPCRWRNDDRGLEPGMYMNVSGNPKTQDIEFQFGSRPPPKMPTIITLAPQNKTGRWLISDTIPRAGPNAIVQFKMWNSPGVFLKVCIRNPNAKQLSKCTPLFPLWPNHVWSPDRTVKIGGPIHSPFELVFWHTGFKAKQGGMAFLDDIEYYDSSLCHENSIDIKPDAMINMLPNSKELVPPPNKFLPFSNPDQKGSAPIENDPLKFKVRELPDGLFDELSSVQCQESTFQRFLHRSSWRFLLGFSAQKFYSNSTEESYDYDEVCHIREVI